MTVGEVFPIPEEAIGSASRAIAGLIFTEAFEASTNKHIDLARAAVAAAAPLILAAAYDQLAEELDDRARRREAVADDDGDPCEDECEEVTCHTVAAVATWFRASGVVRRRASVLRGEGQRDGE